MSFNCFKISRNNFPTSRQFFWPKVSGLSRESLTLMQMDSLGAQKKGGVVLWLGGDAKQNQM